MAQAHVPEKLLVFIPTYNEAENLEAMARELLNLGLDCDILFCDDNSPDGTGEILKRLAAREKRVLAMHRPAKLGIGTAHQAGIRYAYDRGYDTLITLDCDFTHQPADVRRTYDESGGFALTVGSCHLRHDSLVGWSLFRRSLSRLAHLMTLSLLHMPYDATSALRVYRLGQIRRELFERARAPGYAFFFESLYLLHRNNASIHEVPIFQPARTYGLSKMSWGEMFSSVRRLVALWWAAIWDPNRFVAPKPILRPDPSVHDPQGWDSYWLPPTNVTGVTYRIVASLYRRLFIRRRLTFFIQKHYRTGSRLLHAGCGGGQVDSNMIGPMRVTALDISIPALEEYRKNNPCCEAVCQGDILALRFPDGSFDGVYNLGVLEHFTPDDIVKILNEMRRVLAVGGKIVLFWPHERSTSVWALRQFHRVLNSREKEAVRLYPPELTLLPSREFAEEILKRSGFVLEDYYFGPRDLFVQAVVVGRRS